MPPMSFFFFFNDTATTEIYTLSLHDALPIYTARRGAHESAAGLRGSANRGSAARRGAAPGHRPRADSFGEPRLDRKSTRLNSSHGYISYAVFCLKKKMTSGLLAQAEHLPM